MDQHHRNGSEPVDESKLAQSQNRAQSLRQNWSNWQDLTHQLIKVREQWIEATAILGIDFNAARNEHPSNPAFSQWLIQNELDMIAKNDRTALINIGRYPQLFREMAQQSQRQSLQLIWTKEMQPRLEQMEPAERESLGHLPSARKMELSENGTQEIPSSQRCEDDPRLPTGGKTKAQPAKKPRQPEQPKPHRSKTMFDPATFTPEERKAEQRVLRMLAQDGIKLHSNPDEARYAEDLAQLIKKRQQSPLDRINEKVGLTVREIQARPTILKFTEPVPGQAAGRWDITLVGNSKGKQDDGTSCEVWTSIYPLGASLKDKVKTEIINKVEPYLSHYRTFREVERLIYQAVTEALRELDVQGLDVE